MKKLVAKNIQSNLLNNNNQARTGRVAQRVKLFHLELECSWFKSHCALNRGKGVNLAEAPGDLWVQFRS